MSLPSMPQTLSSSSLEPDTAPRISLIILQGDSTIKLWFLIFIIVQANLRLVSAGIAGASVQPATQL